MDKLIKNMSMKMFIALKAKNEFNRKVSRAIILGSDRQYMLEKHYLNFKIKTNL